MRGLVCLDMDRVLVDHLSTWQFVYDRLGINNDESFSLYNQGLLDEWDWIKLDLKLIHGGGEAKLGRPILDSDLRSWLVGIPMMKNWRNLIQTALDAGWKVAIISGGLHQTARDIAAEFPSDEKWRRRWGGIDRHTAKRQAGGMDSLLSVFTNGWLIGQSFEDSHLIKKYGRFQVQMHGKGAVVKMLQRRYGIAKEHTVSVGDSAGDIGMFKESGLAIGFNPWQKRPLSHTDMIIEEKDLNLVLQAIQAHWQQMD